MEYDFKYARRVLNQTDDLKPNQPAFERPEPEPQGLPTKKTSKRLELLGDSVWRTVILERIYLDQNISRTFSHKWNTNDFMMGCAKKLKLPGASGATFEKHIARIYLAEGIAPIKALCTELCKPEDFQ